MVLHIQADARRLLYQRVVLVPRTRALQFYATLRNNPILGSLVRELYSSGSNSCWDLVQNAQLMPGLRKLEGRWFVKKLPQPPPDATIRLRLETLIISDLALSMFCRSFDRTPAIWLDIGSLRRLELIGSTENLLNIGSGHWEELFASQSIEEVALKLFDYRHSTILRLVFHKATQLRVLEMTTSYGQWPLPRSAANGIDRPWCYPVLRQLTLSPDLLYPVLDLATFPSLAVLRVDWRAMPSSSGVSPSERLGCFLDMLRGRITNRPGRFPGLRAVCLLPTPEFIASEASRKETIKKLAALGLSLVDEDDRVLSLE
jgi:hypothetical protein